MPVLVSGVDNGTDHGTDHGTGAGINPPLSSTCAPGIRVDDLNAQRLSRPAFHTQNVSHTLSVRPAEVLDETCGRNVALAIRRSERSSGFWHVDEGGSGINPCPCPFLAAAFL